MSQIPARRLFVSDFSLHSIGVRLVGKKLYSLFDAVVSDLIITGGMQIATMELGDLLKVAGAARDYHLDFDDAYQYTTADANGLTLVSFDNHLIAHLAGGKLQRKS